MENKLLKIIKLADELNEKQDKVYAEIDYTADNSKKLVISIRSKKDYTYVEKCEVQLNSFSMIEWDNVITLFETFVGVLLMNKKEAIAYAQITLDYMQSSKYNGELNPDTLGIEMRQAFRLYPKDIVLATAESQAFARKKLEDIKNGCDTDE